MPNRTRQNGTTDARYKPFDLLSDLKDGEILNVVTQNSTYWIVKTNLSYYYDEELVGGFAVTSNTTSPSIRRTLSQTPFRMLVSRLIVRGEVLRLGQTGTTSDITDFYKGAVV